MLYPATWFTVCRDQEKHYKSAMKIPQEIIKTAQEHGYDNAEYIGAKNDVLIFSLVYNNEDSAPTGLPSIAVIKDGKISIIEGIEALNLL